MAGNTGISARDPHLLLSPLNFDQAALASSDGTFSFLLHLRPGALPSCLARHSTGPPEKLLQRRGRSLLGGLLCRGLQRGGDDVLLIDWVSWKECRNLAAGEKGEEELPHSLAWTSYSIINVNQIFTFSEKKMEAVLGRAKVNASMVSRVLLSVLSGCQIDVLQGCFERMLTSLYIHLHPPKKCFVRGKSHRKGVSLTEKYCDSTVVQ